MNETWRLPDLHDWEISTIHVDPYLRIVDLSLRDPNQGQALMCHLSGVKQYHGSGMMLQNVILDACIFNEETPSDDLNYCKKKLGISVFDIDCFILYIVPSVGMEIICYFQTLEIDFNNP
ncbi:hypothetical protein KDD30_20915 (plasmid) [Photobacterium sp. GJ3]|uniref:hypothetical protein n=1 Tax=Photobacterium sp. GJ3 TaxID=2829502 RepID=UPI001B8C5378|nr:hypothetical protein [Photobacterium sp. GJ3]QUJ69242.1 hypothetical protein KDD30_20915 [Photobacterium sp. GJ3]